MGGIRTTPNLTLNTHTQKRKERRKEKNSFVPLLVLQQLQYVMYLILFYFKLWLFYKDKKFKDV